VARRRGSLRAAIDKLDRAEEHLKVIDGEEVAWLNTRPYRAVRKGEFDGPYEIVRVDMLRPPPDTLAPVIGDCLQNLRSALDHIAFQLAIDNLGRLPTAKEAKKVQFPISGERAHQKLNEFLKSVPGQYLRFIAPDAQAAIHQLQPCQRRNPKHDPLWIVCELNNIDKHRRMLLGGSVVHSADWQPWFIPPHQIETIKVTDLVLNLGLLEQDAEIARVRWKGEPAGPEVDMTYQFMFAIAFAEKRPIRGLTTYPFLRNAAHYIRTTVFPAVAPFLSR
jgi:hypothetical protein